MRISTRQAIGVLDFYKWISFIDITLGMQDSLLEKSLQKLSLLHIQYNFLQRF